MDVGSTKSIITCQRTTAQSITAGETFGDYVPSFELNSENMWALMAKGEFK